MARDLTGLRLPDQIKPADGRFGSGPSKVRAKALAALVEAGPAYLGTSHRRSGVLEQVARLRRGVADLLGAPPGYEVILSNGGTTTFWDAAMFGLIRDRAQFAAFGEFGARFASVVRDAPFLGTPTVREAAPGTAAYPVAEAGVDVYATPQNETSTGVIVPVRRVAGADPGALMMHDATSAAGAVEVDLRESDVYYFAPQKAFGADGGMWLAVVSPAAIERIFSIRASGRWTPTSLDLAQTVEHSRLNQTYNTPALATILLAAEQTDWLLEQGGLAWAARRSATGTSLIYDWATACPVASPYVGDPALRSPVVATIDFDESIDAAGLAAALRANGIVDTEPYRRLGRNQLRIATFPNVEPSDSEALLACLDYLLERAL